MTRHFLITAGFFGAEALAAMGEAYDAVLEALHDTGQPKIVREIIAERIIAVARTGERDPVRLRKSALAGPPGGED
jgi:hypothetical protein